MKCASLARYTPLRSPSSSSVDGGSFSLIHASIHLKWDTLKWAPGHFKNRTRDLLSSHWVAEICFPNQTRRCGHDWGGGAGVLVQEEGSEDNISLPCFENNCWLVKLSGKNFETERCKCRIWLYEKDGKLGRGHNVPTVLPEQQKLTSWIANVAKKILRTGRATGHTLQSLSFRLWTQKSGLCDHWLPKKNWTTPNKDTWHWAEPTETAGTFSSSNKPQLALLYQRTL